MILGEIYIFVRVIFGPLKVWYALKKLYEPFEQGFVKEHLLGITFLKEDSRFIY